MTLLAVKLRNMFPKTYDVKLKNIIINGDKRGCGGFISHNGRTVYVNTEYNPILVRTAKSDKDYRGGRNHYATPKTLTSVVEGLLKLQHIET